MGNALSTLHFIYVFYAIYLKKHLTSVDNVSFFAQHNLLKEG